MFNHFYNRNFVETLCMISKSLLEKFETPKIGVVNELGGFTKTLGQSCFVM